MMFLFSRDKMLESIPTEKNAKDWLKAHWKEKHIFELKGRLKDIDVFRKLVEAREEIIVEEQMNKECKKNFKIFCSDCGIFDTPKWFYERENKSST